MGRKETAVVAARRLRVEKLLLRGYSRREIKRILESQRIINPKSGKPWGINTIINDAKALEETWLESAQKLRQDRKAAVAAELQELKRTAWQEKDHKLVAELLKQERQLFSLDEPIRLDVSGQVDMQHSLAGNQPVLDDMPEDELDMFITNLLEANGVETEIPTVIEGQYEDVE